MTSTLFSKKQISLVFAVFIATVFLSAAELFAKRIVIYKDEGSAYFSVKGAGKTLDVIFDYEQNSIHEVLSAEVIAGKVFAAADIFVLPGGRDKPYMSKLRGDGDENIRSFVKNGGVFLGICAGAYYAGEWLQFEELSGQVIAADRELALFKGGVVGPVLAPYDYYSNRGSRAAWITFAFNGRSHPFYYSGGGYFKADNVSNRGFKKLGAYQGLQQEKESAIIAFSYGKGRVFLSGVHFEIASSQLIATDPYLQAVTAVLNSAEVKRITVVRDLFKEANIY